MTGFEFMAVATIGMVAVGEVVNLAAEYVPPLLDQVMGWF